MAAVYIAWRARWSWLVIAVVDRAYRLGVETLVVRCSQTTSSGATWSVFMDGKYRG